MADRPTPLVDRILDGAWDGDTYIHSSYCLEVGELAKKLERDRARLKEALKGLIADCEWYYDSNKQMATRAQLRRLNEARAALASLEEK